MLQAGISSNKGLQGAIVRTIAFFDLFDYPLTDREVWQWLLGYECDFSEVYGALDSGQWGIGNKNGFYFLAGREGIIEKRLKKYNYTERKFRRAIMIAKLLRLIPWIKMIAVGNNIGAHNLSDGGDIDFFIVAEDGRIWISRFFCVLVVKILGLRPEGMETKDKICLSFFVSESGSDLKNLMIDEDIYFVYWMAGLTPIFAKDGFDFFGRNGWVKKRLPNIGEEKMILKRRIGNAGCGILRILGGLEFLFKRVQKKILPEELKKIADNQPADGPNVVINDKVLKLHSNDRREFFRDEWKRKIYGLSE